MAKIRGIPCKVSFKYPNGRKRIGRVVDATPVRVHEGEKGEGGDYATRIELLEFEDGGMKCIRFAYWRRPEGKKGENDWNWASQTTWVFDTKVTKEAIRDAERKGFFNS